ncbi:MAG: hypothetical protein CMK36_01605 [Porticoccaceae bacterium]|nr:hypothetical protein [Porticoccaceae bacterium]
MPNSDKPTEKQIKIAQVGRPWSKNIFLILVLFAIVVSIMFFLWYHQKLSVDNSLKSIFSKVSSLETSITREKAITSDFRQQLSKSNLLIDRVTSLEKFINKTAKLTTESSDFSGDKWLLMESIYLMRLAKHEAKISRNVEDMVRLLTLIDDIFAELNDPNFLSVRAALAMDIKDLKAMRSNNFEEIFLEISDIGEKIFLLESTKSSTYSIAPILEKPTPDTLDSKTGGLGLWQKLEGFISIQKHSDSIPPLLDSQQESYVRSALLSFLLQARYALFLEQGTIYRINLLEAADTVDRFFPLKSNAVALSHQLRRLAEQPVNRVSLSIERSDNAFAAVIGTEMMDSESLDDRP